ncbi:MAG: ChaN family lipoprotein [Planctomycetota bacterium]
MYAHRDLPGECCLLGTRRSRGARPHGRRRWRNAEERLYDPQNLWDNAMGDAVAEASTEHRDHVVLHVAGGFHVSYRDGTSPSSCAVRRTARSPWCRWHRPPSCTPRGRSAIAADYLVYARTLAATGRAASQSKCPAELRYRLEVPDQGTDWPLLVWLPDRSTRVDDALAQWQLTVGDGAAIAVIEHPFPELQGDLALGGRYAFGDGFARATRCVSHGLARLVECVTRRFPVDAQRIVVAGAGDGGAAVLWTSLYGEWLPVDFVAVAPNDQKRLGMEALPDQKPVARSLRLVASGGDTTALDKVAADYRKVITRTEVVTQDSATFVASLRASSSA